MIYCIKLILNMDSLELFDTTFIFSVRCPVCKLFSNFFFVFIFFSKFDKNNFICVYDTGKLRPKSKSTQSKKEKKKEKKMSKMPEITCMWCTFAHVYGQFMVYGTITTKKKRKKYFWLLIRKIRYLYDLLRRLRMLVILPLSLQSKTITYEKSKNVCFSIHWNSSAVFFGLFFRVFLFRFSL